MNRREITRLDRELTAFVDELVAGMGRKERLRALGWYITGLLLDGERKSIEPMAGRLVDSSGEVEAMRQRLQQAVTVSNWSELELWRRLAQKVDAELPGVEAIVIDDTGFPKKGSHSVGVARQYSGTLARVDNCQVAVSVHLAGENGSACVGMQLYLPESWASDSARRSKAGVPPSVEFKTKTKMALDLLDLIEQYGVRNHVVLADSGYGDANDFRNAIADRGQTYLVGVSSNTSVWGPGAKPSRYGAATSVARLATVLGRTACRSVSWREGSRGPQRSRFGAVRVRTAHRHHLGAAPGEEQWLLYEWPADESEPTKFFLSNLHAGIGLKDLVRISKLRWRIERDYQEMKQEIGLDHFEGRTWKGFHHHAALCAAAHAFLALRRALFPPKPSAVDPASGQAPPSAGAA